MSDWSCLRVMFVREARERSQRLFKDGLPAEGNFINTRPQTFCGFIVAAQLCFTLFRSEAIPTSSSRKYFPPRADLNANLPPSASIIEFLSLPLFALVAETQIPTPAVKRIHRGSTLPPPGRTRSRLQENDQ